MRRCVIGIGVLGALVLSVVVLGRTTSLARGATRSGWVSLFDGKTLKGWQVHTGGDWKVKNGAIACPGTSAGWLGTLSPSNDYVLKLQFRGASTVNSGVFIRAQKEGLPWVSGYECQIWPNMPTGFNTGSLVGSVKALPARIIPNHWNRYEITADGDHFVVVLNGKTLLDAHNSKHLAGKVIGLQCNKNNGIEFRDIMLKPLSR
jgi:3-keto-disaccharide hydrolase